VPQKQQWRWRHSNGGGSGGGGAAMAVQQWWRRRSNGGGQKSWWSTIELYRTLFLSNKLMSYAAFYIGPIQTGFLMTFQKSYGGTGIVIPVEKAPQERKKRESGGFLQELPT
jgi:hypothetical protein